MSTWRTAFCHGRVRARETILGWMPFAEEFDYKGLKNFGQAEFEKVQAINPAEWKREATLQDELFIDLHHTIPKELTCQRDLLISRL